MPICHPSASVACSGKFLKRPGRHPFPPGYSSRARLRDAPARRRQWMLFRRPDKYLSTSFSLSVGATLMEKYIHECNRLREKDGLELRVDTERFTSIFTGEVWNTTICHIEVEVTHYFVGVGGVWPLSLTSLGLAGRTRGLGECSPQEAALDAYINKRKENI